MYNTAESYTANPNDLSKPDYFATRLTEAQLAYVRKKAVAEAEQRMLERNISKLLRKLSPDNIAKALEVPLDQVNRIATKQTFICT